MKDTIIDGSSGAVREVEVSEEEQTQREVDAVKAREEAAKPMPKTALEGKMDVLDERTLGMQDTDLFTLGELQITDERTAGMQDIDDYTLQVVFDMQALIDSQALTIDDLKARVATLEGGV